MLCFVFDVKTNHNTCKICIWYFCHNLQVQCRTVLLLSVSSGEWRREDAHNSTHEDSSTPCSEGGGRVLRTDSRRPLSVGRVYLTLCEKIPESPLMTQSGRVFITRNFCCHLLSVIAIQSSHITEPMRDSRNDVVITAAAPRRATSRLASGPPSTDTFPDWEDRRVRSAPKPRCRALTPSTASLTPSRGDMHAVDTSGSASMGLYWYDARVSPNSAMAGVCG